MQPKTKTSSTRAVSKVALIIIVGIIGSLLSFAILVGGVFVWYKVGHDHRLKEIDSIVAKGDMTSVDIANPETSVRIKSNKSVIKYCLTSSAMNIFPAGVTLNLSKSGKVVYSGGGIKMTGECYKELVKIEPGEYSLSFGDGFKEVNFIGVYQ